jgi:CDP-diacylglycerol---glycerol-3-phosphate 3-phosphatidyltransferase
MNIEKAWTLEFTTPPSSRLAPRYVASLIIRQPRPKIANTSDNRMLPAFNSHIHRVAALLHVAKRHFSTIKVDNPPLNNYLTWNPLLRGTIQQLDAIAPRFELQKGEIEIVTHPAKFYELLKQKIQSAQSRIFLSSLYIGKSQNELVDLISGELERKPELKVDILLDCLRSTRDSPDPSTATLLVPLVKKFGKHRVNLRLYHTPHLHGFKDLLTPKRLNEIYGLQHMKIYGIDDEVILSGANLSQDYFTNRQDRYYLFKSKDLTNYYHRVQNAISSLSYQIAPSGRKEGFFLDWPSSNLSSQPHMNTERFISDCTRVLVPVLKSKYKDIEHEPFDEADGIIEAERQNMKDPVTIVYPISSFTPLLKPDQSTELQSILRVLSILDNKSSKFTITAGYFNVHQQIRNKLINSQATGQVITAAPEANSFYKSKGISYYLPDAYVYNCQLFLEALEKKSRVGCDIKHRVKMLEWQNGIVNTANGWSYHAKGLWINLPREEEPCMTVIGSSNYTKRSYGLDLETNALIITKDEELKKDMKGEIDNLLKYTNEVELKDFTEGKRKVSYGVKMATNIITTML